MKFGCAVLHVGSDKTGSTSIQATLDRGRQSLLAAGCLAYPPGRWHAQLSSWFSTEPERCIFNEAQGLTNRDAIHQSDARYVEQLCQWLEQANPCERLVFSYEGFLWLDADALARFKKFALEWADRVKVMAYVRPPLSYAASALSQRAKGGIPLFTDMPRIPWKALMQTYRSVFNKDELILRKFARDALMGGDVVEDFVQTLHIGSLLGDLTRYEGKENQSISDVAMLLSMKIMEQLEKRNTKMLQSTYTELFGKHLSLVPGDKIRIDPEYARSIVCESEEDIEYFLNEHGISLREVVIDEPGTMCRFGQNPSLVGVIEGIAQFVTQAALGGTGRTDFAEPEFALLSATLEGESHRPSGSLLTFVLEFSLAAEVSELEIGIHVFDRYGRWAFGTNTTLLGQPLCNMLTGTYREQWAMVADLPEGEYTAGFAFAERLEGTVREIAWYDKLVSLRVTRQPVSQSIGYVSLPLAVVCDRIADRVVQPVIDATGMLLCDFVLGDLTAGEILSLPVVLANESAQDWVSLAVHPINICYSWLDDQGGVEVREGERSPLPGGALRAGTSVAVALSVKAPERPGRYRLRAMPVQELLCWFDERGFTPLEINMTVVSPDKARNFPAGDQRLASQVGRKDELGRRISDGRAGYLLFGPYVKLAAGNWTTVLSGTFDPRGGPIRMDVAAQMGAQVFAQCEANGTSDSFRLDFTVDEPVNDLEVRLWVDAGAIATIDGLRIEPRQAKVEPPIERNRKRKGRK